VQRRAQQRSARKQAQALPEADEVPLPTPEVVEGQLPDLPPSP